MLNRRDLTVLSIFIAFELLLFLILAIVQRQMYTSLISPTSAKVGISMSLPDPKNIVFVSDRTGNNEIFKMDLLSNEVTNLTNNPAEDMNPQPSYNGQFLSFYSNRDGDNEIYQMNIATGEIIQLTHNKVEDYDPSYSPDGTKIIYKSNQDDNLGDIFIMNNDGSQQINLTPTRNKTEEWDPEFSRDGILIYFVVRIDDNHLDDEIWVMDRDGKKLKQITNNNVPDWYPSINPSDGKIVYISKKSRTAADDLFIMEPLGKKQLALTTMSGNDADPSWSINGQEIVYINDRDGDYDLYLMKADGSNIVKVEDNSSTELAPIFLP